jgi:hypothetical protein
VDYVLSGFGRKNEKSRKNIALAEAVIFAATHRLEEAMSKFNRNPASPD